MKIVCLSVGKKHDPSLAGAIAKYEKRLTAYVEFSFELIPPSEKQKESAGIMQRLKSDDVVTLLDERGIQLDNEMLISFLQTQQMNATKRLVIIIGGAYGVTTELQQRSDAVFSLSSLVLPHQIVRLLITEQLYRSFNTLAGGKYHHA